MEIIKKYIDSVVTEEALLSKDQAIEAFNLFIIGKKPSGVSRTLHIKKSKLELLYTRLYEVRDMTERIVKHEAWLEKPIAAITHFDEESGEIVIDTPATEGELCPVPQTLEKLIERSIELISQDYAISEPLFAATSVDELIDAIVYVVTKIVTYSNATNDADYSWWKSQVTGG